MAEKIAVTFKGKSDLAPLAEADTLMVFEKRKNAWIARKEIPYQIDLSTNLQEIRNQVRNLITKLDDCTIIVSESITGLVYNVFDRMGFHIFEVPAFQATILDDILMDIANNTESIERNESIPTAPIETIDGIYFLDLIQLQTNRPDVSSKKALQPFLHNTPFIKLDMLCSHLPPWLENTEYKSDFDIVNKKSGSAVLVTITKKICKY
jgi:Fe-only nitrogenase accessory protein AnfO